MNEVMGDLSRCLKEEYMFDSEIEADDIGKLYNEPGETSLKWSLKWSQFVGNWISETFWIEMGWNLHQRSL